MRNYCKVDPLSDSDVIWVRVQKQVTKLNCDLFLGFVYLPPVNSVYGKAHGNYILQTIEKHIECFLCRGKVILGGDFNARVGELNEILMKDDDLYLTMPHDDTFEFILSRVSHDSKTTNRYGKWLIDLCMDNKLYVLNGRTLGDLGGKFACHTRRGSSAVDYLITSFSLSNEVLSMNVSDLTLYSDHCCISMKLNIYCENFADEWHHKNKNDLSFTYLPDKFIWKEVN